MKKSRLFLVLILIVAIVINATIAWAAYDDTSNTDGTGKTDWDSASGGQWAVSGNATGTTYSIVMNGQTYSYDLPAGTSITGSEGIKGYDSNPVGDYYGSEYQLTQGVLELQPSDFAALAESQGDTALAEAIRNGASFTAFSEQYIDANIPGEGVTRLSATEAKAMLEAHLANGGSASSGIGWIGSVIDASFISFTELEQNDPLRMYMELLGLDQQYMEGFGIYVFEDGEIIIVPEEVNTNPLYTLSYAGDIGCSNTPNSKLEIESKENFKVAAGNTIPTSEVLGVQEELDLVGEVHSIETWQISVLRPETYTATASWYSHDRYSTWVDSGYWSGDKETGREWIDTSHSSSVTVEKGKSPSVGSNETITGGPYKEYTELSRSSESPTLPSPSTKSYTVTYSAGVTDVNGVTVTNEVIGGKRFAYFNGPGLTMTGQSDTPGNADSRVGHWLSAGAGQYETYDAAATAAQNQANTPPFSKYWSIASDSLPLTVNGGKAGGSAQYSANCPVLTSDLGVNRWKVPFREIAVIDPEHIENRCEEGRDYETTEAYHIIGGRERTDYPINDVNDVRVHTPIYNELIVDPINKNQLENLSLAKDSSGKTVPIVTLGEAVNVTVKVWGSNTQKDSHYYDDNIAIKLQNISKYVKEVRVKCSLCGLELSSKSEDPILKLGGKDNNSDGFYDEYTHTCTAGTTYKKEDNKVYPITSIVIAENVQPEMNESDVTENARYNTPDKYHIIKQTSGVYVAGKMYDLEVRATDDPGWKDFRDKVAQKLNRLPVGETGDNLASAYKMGLKLGYRAFFDLKTLGVATESIKITPRIYYIKPDGTVDNNVDIYYRTGPKTYKLLADNTKVVDTSLVINMSMNTTYGDKYNVPFKEETLQTINLLNNAINYAKLYGIGNLSEIELNSNQSLVTKFDTNNDGITEFVDTPNYRNSRRWYGEIYIPASTVVAKCDSHGNSDINKVANKVGLHDKGYLLLTFEPIETTTVDGKQYLRYSTSHNPDGTDYANGYIMMTEKDGKGKTEKITLPNGVYIGKKTTPETEFNKMVIDIPNVGEDKTEKFYSDVAPIIIYDISLRANNDYETSGTH